MAETLISIVSAIGIILVALIALVIIVKSCWKVAGTNEVLIVSGLGKKPRLKTGGGISLSPCSRRHRR